MMKFQFQNEAWSELWNRLSGYVPWGLSIHRGAFEEKIKDVGVVSLTKDGVLTL
jgi:hypothetical protein